LLGLFLRDKRIFELFDLHDDLLLGYLVV